MSGIGRLTTGAVLGLGWKVLVLGALVSVVVLGSRWYRLAKVERYCQSSLPGLSRDEAERRAVQSGLRVQRGESRDTAVHKGPGLGLAWCFLDHDGTRVTGATFAKE
jgi:hypothetical protein